MTYAKKSLGQNFLIDLNIVKKILNLVEIRNRNIIEIGPGKGALTKEILKKNPKSLFLIEKDTSLAKNLKLKYANNDCVKIFNKDVLSFNFENIKEKNFIIFGNLPYNISSQILIKFIKFKIWPPKFSDLVFMFQKELGEKIIGKYLTSNYSRISVLTNYRLRYLKKFSVSPNCFIPRPKVNSIVIHFKPKKNSFKLKKIENLEDITHLFFSNKRKMINKNIKKILNENEIKQIKDLNLNLRPSELSPEIYYRITQIFENKLKLFNH